MDGLTSGHHAAAVEAIEKWLQSVDPLAAVDSKGGSQSTVGTAAARRRKLQPLKLHPQHSLVTEAYLLLARNLQACAQSGSATSASGSGTGSATFASGSGAGSLCGSREGNLQRAGECLRRCRQSLKTVLPSNHPDIASLGLDLVDVLTQLLAVRRSSGSGSGSGPAQKAWQVGSAFN